MPAWSHDSEKIPDGRCWDAPDAQIKPVGPDKGRSSRPVEVAFFGPKDQVRHEMDHLELDEGQVARLETRQMPEHDLAELLAGRLIDLFDDPTTRSIGGTSLREHDQNLLRRVL